MPPVTYHLGGLLSVLLSRMASCCATLLKVHTPGVALSSSPRAVSATVIPAALREKGKGVAIWFGDPQYHNQTVTQLHWACSLITVGWNQMVGEKTEMAARFQRNQWWSSGEGKLSADLLRKMPGNLCHSRWATLSFQLQLRWTVPCKSGHSLHLPGLTTSTHFSACGYRVSLDTPEAQ